jgi:hypothetical protein
LFRLEGDDTKGKLKTHEKDMMRKKESSVHSISISLYQVNQLTHLYYIYITMFWCVDCDTFVAETPDKRCKRKQPGTGGKKVQFFCPATCKEKCFSTSPTDAPTHQERGECENLSTFGFRGNESKTCDEYVAQSPRKRCKRKKPGSGGEKDRLFCQSSNMQRQMFLNITD